jgi:hypothetical protein
VPGQGRAAGGSGRRDVLGGEAGEEAPRGGHVLAEPYEHVPREVAAVPLDDVALQSLQERVRGIEIQQFR